MAAAAPVSGRAPRPAGCRGRNGPSSAASEIAALHPCPRGGGRLRVCGDPDGGAEQAEAPRRRGAPCIELGRVRRQVFVGVAPSGPDVEPSDRTSPTVSAPAVPSSVPSSSGRALSPDGLPGGRRRRIILDPTLSSTRPPNTIPMPPALGSRSPVALVHEVDSAADEPAGPEARAVAHTTGQNSNTSAAAATPSATRWCGRGSRTDATTAPSPRRTTTHSSTATQ
jgi:hypothetical protein